MKITIGDLYYCDDGVAWTLVALGPKFVGLKWWARGFRTIGVLVPIRRFKKHFRRVNTEPTKIATKADGAWA